MAIFKAMSLVSTAVYEAASLVWIEIALFLVAALLYVAFVGGSRKAAGSKPGKKTRPPTKASGGSAAPSGASVPQRDGTVAQELRHHAALGAHAAVLKAWQGIEATTEVSSVDLALFVDSMRRLGRSVSDTTAELQAGLGKNPALLPSFAALPAALLRDNNMDVLDGALQILEEQGSPAEPKMYAGLMTAQLRRRNYTGVAGIAERVPAEALTPKMLAMLAAAAAHRGRLDEALDHLRQMPAVGDGPGALAPGLAAQILGLAARDQRVATTTQELQRLQARLESRHLDDLVAAEARRRGLAAALEILEAGTALNVPKGPGAYQALASALAQAGNKAGFRALLEDLEAESKLAPASVSVGEPLAIALLDACKVFRESEFVPRIADLHRAACGGAQGARLLAATCGAMVACGQAAEACDFYEREMVPKGVLPDAVLTGCLMKAAGSLGRTELAQRLSEHASSTRCAAPASSGGGTSSELQRHATMIKSYARERDLKGATSVFGKLKASGISLSPMIYNCYLDACSQCGDMDAAVKHFEEMEKLNFLDIVGYNTMLKAYLSRGRTEDARSLMKAMSARGLQANKVTYNELLHAKVMAKDRAGIWQVIDEMKAAGVRVNSVTCSILLKSLTVQTPHSDVRRVTGLIDDVEEPIDEVLFSSVIEACIRIQQLELLSDLMKKYRAKGCFANLSAPTYGSMIKAYGQAGDAARVNELWDEMVERGVKPTSITLGCMVEALVVNGQSERALELIHKELANEERKGQINTVIYSTVLKGFAVVHRIEKVFACYDEMRDYKIPCNTITYNTMLDACAKCSAMDRASGLLMDMRESCVEPDIITYSTIVKGYCLAGDVDRAFQVLEDMKSDGKFQPDEIMYNSILDGCAKQHRTDEALRVLEEMKASGVGPSNYTLSILVKLLGHARRLGQAFRMVDDLSAQHGFRPNVQVYTCLVQACVLNRKLDKALALYDTMVADAGCRVDEKFYAVLVRGCLQLHQPWKALDVVRAAYQLPGHGLAAPARREIVGVEARTLDEFASKLQNSGPEEQEALSQLTAELLEKRSVRIGGGGRGGGGRGAGSGWQRDNRQYRGGAGGRASGRY